jgi:hypothetical protein
MPIRTKSYVGVVLIFFPTSLSCLCSGYAKLLPVESLDITPISLEVTLLYRLKIADMSLSDNFSYAGTTGPSFGFFPYSFESVEFGFTTTERIIMLYYQRTGKLWLQGSLTSCGGSSPRIEEIC